MLIKTNWNSIPRKQVRGRPRCCSPGRRRTPRPLAPHLGDSTGYLERLEVSTSTSAGTNGRRLHIIWLIADQPVSSQVTNWCWVGLLSPPSHSLPLFSHLDSPHSYSSFFVLEAEDSVSWWSPSPAAEEPGRPPPFAPPPSPPSVNASGWPSSPALPAQSSMWPPSSPLYQYHTSSSAPPNNAWEKQWKSHRL